MNEHNREVTGDFADVGTEMPIASSEARDDRRYVLVIFEVGRLLSFAQRPYSQGGLDALRERFLLDTRHVNPAIQPDVEGYIIPVQMPVEGIYSESEYLEAIRDRKYIEHHLPMRGFFARCPVVQSMDVNEWLRKRIEDYEEYKAMCAELTPPPFPGPLDAYLARQVEELDKIRARVRAEDAASGPDLLPDAKGEDGNAETAAE